MEARFQQDLEDAIERTNKQACLGKTSSVECEKTQHDNAMKQIMDEKDAVNENLVRDLELVQQKLESQTNCL
ncbi:hypothetical protein Pelo_19776 [Pelomyxa schiedti]|nr:hypothetical protein Pelo_19776 [Pelomyxa schiedti]